MGNECADNIGSEDSAKGEAVFVARDGLFMLMLFIWGYWRHLDVVLVLLGGSINGQYFGKLLVTSDWSICMTRRSISSSKSADEHCEFSPAYRPNVSFMPY